MLTACQYSTLKLTCLKVGDCVWDRGTNVYAVCVGQRADGHLELLYPGVKDGIVAELPEKMIGLGPDYLRLPFTARDTLRAKGWICGDDLLAMVMQRLATLEKQV